MRRTWSRRTKALVLVAVMYAVAFGLAAAITAAAEFEVRTAQHGPVVPAPTP